jgi:chloramphenicol-sensitive protein RarD
LGTGFLSVDSRTSPLGFAPLSLAPAHPQASRGALAATAGFLIWGIVPIYWKQLQHVSATELIMHRIVWSLFLLFGVLAVRKEFGSLRPAFTSWRNFGLNLLASLLLSVNWLVYVWGVNQGHIIECSLGYFLTPLGNVALGFLFLHERLRTWQWVAIAFAAAGVAMLLLGVGHVPWIALTLASTWSTYAILKKRSGLGAIAGLTVETVVLAPVAVAALVWWHQAGGGVLGRADALTHALVLSVGVITAVPLLLFAYGAQRIRLTTLGLLQYLSPSVQFLLGYLVYREPFDAGRFAAYALIWCGLAIYTGESFWAQRKRLFG